MKPFVDEYGFAAAAQTSIRMFNNHTRASGRTTRLIERVKCGDGIICGHSHIKRDIEYRLREARKVGVHVFVVDPRAIPMQTIGTLPNGRMYFEHTWVQEYFEHVIADAEQVLGQFVKATSKTWPDAPDQERAQPSPRYGRFVE